MSTKLRTNHVFWKLILPTLVFALTCLRPIGPRDYWWHVKMGQIIWQTKTIPKIDLFSFTQFGQPWTNQSWLAELIFYSINHVGGLNLTIFIHGMILAMAMAIYLHSLFQLSNSLSATVIGGLFLSLLTYEQWMLRPQVFSILNFAILVVLINRYPSHPRQIWLTLPLMLIWANLHGGFIFGLAILGLFVLSNARRSPWLIWVLAGAILACSVTPMGPFEMIRYVFSFLQHETTRNINPEFATIDFRSPLGLRVMIALLTLLLLPHRSKGHVRTETLLGLGLFLIAGCLAVRNLLWFGFLAGQAIAVMIAPGITDIPQRRSHLYTVLNGMLVLTMLFSAPSALRFLPASAGKILLTDSETPVQVVSELCQDASVTARRTFNQVAFGSYIIWACPNWPVFIDTRMELYPDTQWRDYIRVSNAQENWQSIVDTYRIEALLLYSVTQTSLIQQVRQSQCWSIEIQDGIATYAVRTEQCALIQ